ncbi:MAG: GTP 3',8-cyclase MoaA [Melioribacter sp.]|nr:GTP 3',8-cyclase MoaA [Melioribacter sp.]
MFISDKYGRTFGTLRVSLTNVCNFYCTYCREEGFISKKNGLKVLNYMELAEIVNVLNKIFHFKSIRLTGGEPTLYHNLIPFIERLRFYNIDNIKITSNGYLLKKIAQNLSVAGVRKINISLDAIDSKIFYLITRTDALNKVIEGIEESLRNNISVKINSVIMRNINENQIIPLLEFGISKNIKVRFLELMKMGHLYFKEFDKYFYSTNKIISVINNKYLIVKSYRRANATATYWQIENGYEFGTISNESQPFCSDCDRLRLDSYGNIYGCISSEVKENIANIIHDENLLKDSLIKALSQKQSIKFTGCATPMIAIGG